MAPITRPPRPRRGPLRRIGRVLAVLLVLGIAAAALLPLLIPTEPLAVDTTAQEAATEESRFLEIPFPGTEGLSIHYLAEGPEGEAPSPAPGFLLLHGFTFNAFTWRELLPELAAHGRAVAYDQVPYGLSAKPTAAEWSGPSPFTPEAAVDHLLAVQEALEMEQAVLVANSVGSAIALNATLRAPERVAGLVLINPKSVVNRPTLPRWLAETPQLYRLGLWGSRWLGQSTALLEASYHDTDRITAADRRFATLHAQTPGWDLAWAQVMQRALTNPLERSEDVERIEAPVLILVSEQDEIVPPEDPRGLAEALPRSRLVTLEDCGHAAQQECPGQVYEAIAGWLAERRSQSQ